MLRAVIFDFDGLLLDTETAEYEAWARIFRAHGAQLPVQAWGQFVGHWVDGRAFALLEERTGRPVDREALRRQHQEAFFAQLERTAWCAGAPALVSSLRRAGVRVAIASNSDAAWVHGHLEQRHFKRHFDVICTSDDVARLKPEPDLYRLALRRLGVQAQEAAAFEDSPPGVTAALRAGLRVYAVPNAVTEHLDFPAGAQRLASLAAVTAADLQERWPGTAPNAPAAQ